MDEKEIIAQIINGIDRYEELVRRYHVGLIIHCERILNNRDDAQDIAQEAFIRAYLELDKFDPQKARFSTWLYRIAINLTIDQLRKQKRKVDVENIELIAEVTMPTHMEDEERKAIHAAVAALEPLKHRQVIESYYWEGKSYQEIADELSVPINTVRTWIHRAKEQLKEQLS